MIKDEYSPYKIIHHLEKIQEMKEGKQPNPTQIHLVPSNRCNQNCTFCAYRIPESLSGQTFNHKDVIPREKLLEIIDSCKDMGIKAIQYTGGGEPLVHPAIKEAFYKTLSNKIDLSLVSNGQALDDELIEILSDVSWVRISIDASNANTYSLMRRAKARIFDKVTENIGKLAKAKKKTVLGVGFVVNKENYTEIYDACKLMKDIGVDNFRISACFTPLGFAYFDSIHQEAKEMAEMTKNQLEDENFTVFNLYNDRLQDLFDGVQNYDYCPMKDLVPYIGADQNVYTCCMLAYNKLGYIGSVTDSDLTILWNSKQKRDFFTNHSPRSICKIPCMFEGKNHFINYCIKTNPKHINFI